jgi:uncharacterized protein (TIGR04255 family)
VFRESDCRRSIRAGIGPPAHGSRPKGLHQRLSRHKCSGPRRGERQQGAHYLHGSASLPPATIRHSCARIAYLLRCRASGVGVGLVVRPPDLPDFDAPPVVETVLSVHFRPIGRLTGARIGQFWQRHLVDELPDAEERPPYEAPVERFGADAPTVALELTIGAPTKSRSWFSSDSTVLQLQQDWIAYNWRKTPQSPTYVHYETGREKFAAWLRLLDEYCARELGDAILPNQCEVTYVNRVALTDVDRSRGPFGSVLADVSPGARDYVPAPESASYSAAYAMHESDDNIRGRLHVTARSALDLPDREPIVLLNLTARGRPLEPTIDAALRFCDVGRRWIVRGFKDLTTSEMHERWRIKEELTDGSR